MKSPKSIWTRKGVKMIKENLFVKDCIRTYTGKYLNVRDPQPDEIDIIDIAVGLSRMPRFAGHSVHFLPVAQHCIQMSKMAPEEHQLAALLHDASEAYLGDIAKPIKDLLPAYREIEDRLMRVIAKKFGFQWPLHEIVKKLDYEMLVEEWENKVLEHAHWNMDEKQAYIRFLDRYIVLTNERELIGG